MVHAVHNPEIPLVHPIWETVAPGVHFDVRGKVHNHHDKVFVIELLSGPHIVFHMSFRFSHDQHQIVLNASSHGNWGEEVRYHNPLHNGDHFHLHVHVHSGHYEVEVNGNKIGTFHHRFPVESIQALGIHGGVHIDSIEFGGFAFERDWGHHQNPDSHFGHAGFIGYGTSAYQPPQFNDPQHPHQRYF
jgi:hypothetical protein